MDYEIKYLTKKESLFRRTRKRNISYKCLLIPLILILIFFFFYFNIKFQYLLTKILKSSSSSNETQGQPYFKLNSNDLDSRIKLLKLITNNNELIYKGIENCLRNDPDSQLCFYHLIYPRKVTGKKRILLGQLFDGSYVLVDDFTNIKVAYSFGISNTVHFDRELANRGIDVYMYDHTINGLPYTHPKFHWKKIGICGKNEINEQLKTF